MKIGLLTASMLAAGLAATPLLAQEAKEVKEVSQRVIILESGDNAKDGKLREFRVLRDAKGGKPREFRMLLDGKDGHAFKMVDCDGEKTEIDEGGGDKEKTKVFLCLDGKLTGEERVKKLEELRSKMASDEHFSAEHRARVSAALQKAIDAARASK